MTPIELHAERARIIRSSPRLRAAAWKSGQLWWKLHYFQALMYQQFYASTVDEEVWNCARRLGKSYLLTVLMLETVLRKQRGRAALAASTATDVTDIIEPMVEEIIDDAPSTLRPVPKFHRGRIEVPHTGGVVKIAGCDHGNYKRLRGRGLDLWAVDEGGFVDELERVVDSVLAPQTWTTGGRGIIASTPPDTPGHHFHQRYLIAKKNGAAARYTFDDNPMLSPERKLEIVEKHARRKNMTVEEFKRSTVYRREYLAEFVTESERAVFPVLDESLATALSREVESVPIYADCYVVGDLGGTRDPTGLQASRWDYMRQKWTILGDIILVRPTTEQIANAWRALEDKHFGPERERSQRIRILDDQMGIVSRDLTLKHKLPMLAPFKDDKQAGCMDVCDMMVHRQMEFGPEASQSLAHCQAAIWNKQHTEFERVEGFGHFELADCTLYGARNVRKNMGKVPAGLGIRPDEMFQRNDFVDPPARPEASLLEIA